MGDECVRISLMITYIIPGYSPHNKAWAEEVAKRLRLNGEIRPVFWEHWNDPENKFKPKEKANLLVRHAKGDKVNIIAKSIGTLVASEIVNQISQDINKVIFCGIPVNDIGSENSEFIKSQIKKLDDKIIIFQNVDDPHGSFEQVKSFGNVHLMPRNDHDYPYFEDFNKFLS